MAIARPRGEILQYIVLRKLVKQPQYVVAQSERQVNDAGALVFTTADVDNSDPAEKRGAVKSSYQWKPHLMDGTAAAAYIREVISRFVLHKHTDIVQSKVKAMQLASLVVLGDEGHFSSTADFGMNYSHGHPRQLQRDHFCTAFSALFPIHSYTHSAAEGMIERCVAFVSDDGKHSNKFVQHCISQLFDIFKRAGLNLNTMHLWSDNCSSQFKMVVS